MYSKNRNMLYFYYVIFKFKIITLNNTYYIRIFILCTSTYQLIYFNRIKLFAIQFNQRRCDDKY